MPKTKTKPGPKPKYAGERVDVHLRIPKTDYEYIQAMGLHVNSWMVDIIVKEVAQIRETREQQKEGDAE